MKRFIKKASGHAEIFSKDKIRSSFIRSGVSKNLADETARLIEKRLKPTTSSEELYRHAHKYLLEKRPEAAARYSLKRAIMQLGPAGYIFERYMARIFEKYGYTTKVGQIIKGYCVNHEIDVVALKKGRHYMIECKYHNRPGTRSDVKVALYTYGRFLDVEKMWRSIRGHRDLFHQPWLVTNTRCTSEAIKYARCVNLRIVAWRYPPSRGLEYFIEKKRLYPVTILPSLSISAARRLSVGGVLLAEDVLKYSAEELIRNFSLKPSTAAQALKQARWLCTHPYQHQANAPSFH